MSFLSAAKKNKIFLETNNTRCPEMPLWWSHLYTIICEQTVIKRRHLIFFFFVTKISHNLCVQLPIFLQYVFRKEK